jgi:hypothetical protein
VGSQRWHLWLLHIAYFQDDLLIFQLRGATLLYTLYHTKWWSHFWKEKYQHAMEKDVRKSTCKLNKLGRHGKPHIYLYNLYRCNPLKVLILFISTCKLSSSSRNTLHHPRRHHPLGPSTFIHFFCD